MLFILLLLVYNLVLFYLAGLVLSNLFARIFNCNEQALHPTFYILLGMSLVAVILQVLHLFMPINAYAHVIIWLICLSIPLLDKKKRSLTAIHGLHQIFTKVHIGYTIIVIIAVIIATSAKTATGDIGDYHLQAIRWYEEFSTVPGLANIRRQLANNSSWFLLQAFSGLHFFDLRSIYVLNGLLMLVAGWYFLPNLSQKFWLRNLIIIIYLSFALTRKYAGGVTNDIIITWGILLLFSWYADEQQTSSTSQFKNLIIIWLSLFLVTCKLSALPMVLLSLIVIFAWYQVLKTQRLILVVKLIFLLVILFIPWLIKNILLSGYLVFPIKFTRLHQVDWAMRPEIVDFEVYANLAYARVPFLPIEEVRYYSFKQWFPLWIQSLDYFSLGLIAATIFFISAIVLLMVVNRSFKAQVKQSGLLFIIPVCILAYYLWYTHGPTPRFIFGYMVFTIATGFSLVMPEKIEKLVHKLIKPLALTAIIIATLSLIGIHYRDISNKQYLVYPKPFIQPELKDYAVSNGILKVPIGDMQCWDAPLPCTNLPDSMLQFRGNSLGDGFRIRLK
ncbi:MAG: hypothetical protein MUC81_00120 [Bacteroidia bacterium]|jgi:hypothetical protein|nr:hypothetical protein [Bacteroidia bacterium]